MSDDFASQFEDLFRTTYSRAVRRIRDKRDRLTPETVALLDHMAAAGPMTASELARHIDRAPSTLSEMLTPIKAKGLIASDKDPQDARRSLIWLTDEGQAALIAARHVLDAEVVAGAAGKLSAEERSDLLRLFGKMVSHLKGDPHES